MASGKSNYEYHAIVLHSDDEYRYARKFCDALKNIEFPEPLRITTFEEFCLPGHTLIDGLEEAMDAALYIFCSENYYETDEFGRFAGQVGIMDKLPDRFVKIRTGGTRGCKSMKPFKGMRLTKSWEIPELELENIWTMFSKAPEQPMSTSDPADRIQAASPEVPEEAHLEEALSELLFETHLVVENPSLWRESQPSTEAVRAEAAPQPVTPPPTSTTTKRRPPSVLARGGSLPKDDLEEDSENPAANNAEKNSAHLAEASGGRQQEPFQARGRAVGQSETNVHAAPPANMEKENLNPSFKILLIYCIVICFVAYCCTGVKWQ